MAVVGPDLSFTCALTLGTGESEGPVPPKSSSFCVMIVLCSVLGVLTLGSASLLSCDLTSELRL